MARNKFNIGWGDTGTQPTDGEDHQSGEKPDAQVFDWFWYNTIVKVNSIWDEFARLDSNDDGVVDRADYADDADASTYKGNDIDSDEDGVVNEADYANDADASTYKGNDIDSDKDGKVDSADTADYAYDADASTYKGNDIDTNEDGVVDFADHATNANNANVATVGEQIEARTSYPSSPADGRIVLRTDLT